MTRRQTTSRSKNLHQLYRNFPGKKPQDTTTSQRRVGQQPKGIRSQSESGYPTWVRHLFERAIKLSYITKEQYCFNPLSLSPQPTITLPPTVNHVAGTIPLPPTAIHAARTIPLPPTAIHAARTIPLPPTATHIARTITLPPIATHAAGTIPLPPTATHVAGTITLPPTATPVARTITLPPHRNSRCQDNHPTSPPQLTLPGPAPYCPTSGLPHVPPESGSTRWKSPPKKTNEVKPEREVEDDEHQSRDGRTNNTIPGLQVMGPDPRLCKVK
uniref:Uncharacterized protein n=1 Tax=Timema tahoe TaxID=61484 RepID=A0A7R9NU06_9NEOP|nr:unnamed protein product [Timema tahoe]